MHGDSPLVRQWLLLQKLCSCPSGTTVEELMRELAVSEKTVRRDLETFQRAGFPLREQLEDHGRKRWRIDSAAGQPGLWFAYDEAAALHLGRRFLEPLAGTLLWEAAQRAFRKIRAMLSPGALKYLDKFAPIFHQTQVGARDYARKSELLDDLMRAIEERRITHITYQSLRATEPVTYDIYPLGLVNHGHSLYLIGFSPRHEQERTWKIDRIEDVEVTRLQFQQRGDFDLRQYLARSFGIFHGDGDVHVKVRFSPAVSRYVQEGRWHASQRLTRQPDGSLLAEFDLSTTEEIKHWILSFGKEAEVLEPAQLRQEMTAELESLWETYRIARCVGEGLTAGKSAGITKPTSPPDSSTLG